MVTSEGFGVEDTKVNVENHEVNPESLEVIFNRRKRVENDDDEGREYEDPPHRSCRIYYVIVPFFNISIGSDIQVCFTDARSDNQIDRREGNGDLVVAQLKNSKKCASLVSKLVKKTCV